MRELEGKTVRQIGLEVRGWMKREGAVVQIGDGRVVKVKKGWWL